MLELIVEPFAGNFWKAANAADNGSGFDRCLVDFVHGIELWGMVGTILEFLSQHCLLPSGQLSSRLWIQSSDELLHRPVALLQM